MWSGPGIHPEFMIIGMNVERKQRDSIKPATKALLPKAMP